MPDDANKLHSATLPWEEREINGRHYRVDRLGWWEVNDTIEGLTEILGPSLCSLLDEDTIDVSTILDASGGKVGSALVGALERSVRKNGKGRALMERLGRQTMIEDDSDGQRDVRHVRLSRDVMDIWFSRYPGDAIPWLLFALEVQVWDFFGPLIVLMRAKKATAESGHSETPKAKAEESTSPST